MDGLPFLPGFRFNNVTKQNYHVSAQFQWKNGYALPKEKSIGIGKDPLDVDSMMYYEKPVECKPSGYDPTMTYGKVKDPPKPIFLPRFVRFDKQCLSFVGYTKQIDLESPLNTYRIRRVQITYFLVDDTISIVEPAFENAGYVQGSLLKRGPIPNPHRENSTWHWSNFNVGIELSFYGVIYRLCSCDAFTRHFLSNEGIKLGSDEPVPVDPYFFDRCQEKQRHLSKGFGVINENQASEIAKFRQFIQYDGQMLRFYSAWFDNTIQQPQWKYFVILYFMANDQIEIHNSKKMNEYERSQNPYTTFLRKVKLPVDWTALPPDSPFIYPEPRSNENKEYYKPKDLIIGNIIFIMGRKFLLYDCDLFTRNYFKQNWQIIQPEPIKIDDPNKIIPTVFKKIIPPHTGIGDPDDTLQNCISLTPKPRKTDFIKYVLNAHKKFRYKLKLIPVYEEDKFRDFIMEFCLGNDHITITELGGKNSGFIKGRFVASNRVRKPNTNIDDNIFYGPKDFAIGAKLHINGLVFEIVELDVWTYKYMKHHKYMFSQEAIDGAKSFLESKGLLDPQKNDTEEANSTFGNESLEE